MPNNLRQFQMSIHCTIQISNRGSTCEKVQTMQRTQTPRRDLQTIATEKKLEVFYWFPSLVHD